MSTLDGILGKSWRNVATYTNQSKYDARTSLVLYFDHQFLKLSCGKVNHCQEAWWVEQV